MPILILSSDTNHSERIHLFQAGANAYMGVYLAVMTYQFAVTLLMTAYNPSIAYFNKMQSINMELGAALRGGTSPTSGSNRVSPKKKKKKR